MAEPLDVRTLQPEGPVPFDFSAAEDLAARFRASGALVSAQQLPRRGELADTAREDWLGQYADIFDTRVTQCASDAERLAEALSDAVTKVEQLAQEAREEQTRRDRANEYLIEHAAWREREQERNNDLVPEFMDFSSHDEPEAPDMTGEPSSLPLMDPNIGPRESYADDAVGRLLEVVDPLGALTRQEYDAAGQLTRIVDPLGRATSLAYDAAGRLVEHDDGSKRRGRWTYDAAGRTRTFGPAGRDPVTIRRDVLGRQVAIEEPGLPAIALEWDRAGRLVERRRGDLAMRWSYDDDGQRTGLGFPDGTSLSYAYDDGGVLSDLRHPSLGAIELERDPAGRLVAASADGMSARWRTEDGDLAEYALDAGGVRRSAQLERDAVGRVVAATVDGDRRSYAYDPAGQLLAADSAAGAFAFAYDACGRLVHESSPTGAIAYEHDTAGQLTRRRDADGGTTAYAYDDAGRRVRESASDLSRCWEWDEQGRLRAIRSQPAGADEQTTSVVVDALGELAEVDGMLVAWDSADPLSPLAWLDEQAVVGAGAPWAQAGDGAATWLAPDWQGTIGPPRLDPWGAPGAAADPAATPSPQLGYRGELELASSVWLRARVYEPESRSFPSPDPLPAVAGAAWAANPYSYAANNPIGLSDPLGLRPVTDAQMDAIREQQIQNNASGWSPMSLVHTALDVAGFIPGFGAVADVLNAGLYLAEGNYEEAAWAMAAAVPGVGDLAKASRIAKNGAEMLVKHADEAADAARSVPRFVTTPSGVTIDRLSVRTTVSPQKQGRHVLDAPEYRGGSYFDSGTDAQRVLDDFHSGDATILGLKSNNDIVVRADNVTGFNHNPGAGFPNQPTNVFFIKGTSSPSVVPYNPTWQP